CTGGTNDGRPCCRADDCPGGACGADDCARNRDDVPGCCRCDCTTTTPRCGDCDDGNPCTADACGPDGCTHSAVPDGTSCGAGDACHGGARCEAATCTAGAVVSCGDGDTCTLDACDPARGCQHERIGFADARQALEA